MANFSLKLRYRKSYISSLIGNIPQGLIIPVSGTRVTVDGTVYDLAEYNLSGLAFCNNPGDRSQFDIWKVLARNPVRTDPVTGAFIYNSDPATDMLFLKVSKASFASGEVSWWLEDKSNPNCLKVAADSTSHSILELGVEDGTPTLDFAFFEAMGMLMQCQGSGSDGIFISSAQVVLHNVYFRLSPVPTINTIKSERLVPSSLRTPCIEDASSFEGTGRLSQVTDRMYTENPPHALVGTPCPPFWGILYPVEVVENLSIRLMNEDQSTEMLILNKLKGVEMDSISRAHERVIKVLEKAKLNIKGIEPFINQTIGAYFRTLATYKQNGGKYISEQPNTHLRVSQLAADKLRFAIKNPQDKIEAFHVSSENLNKKKKRAPNE